MTDQIGPLSFIRRHLGLLIFLGFAILGILNVSDYGVSWDEPAQRRAGAVSFDYIHNQDQQDLQSHEDNVYGVAIELPLVYLERILGLEDTREIFLMRHLVTHLLFLSSGWCFYLLVIRLYKSRWLGVLGFLALTLHPRLYSHSFFNSKDLPFLAVFIIALWLAAIAFDRKRLRNFLWLGIITGLLINVRVMGILMAAAVAGLLIIDLFLKPDRRTVLRNLCVFLSSTALTLYASFPFLWEKPFANLAAVFETMSRYPWEEDVLFSGQSIPATELPWHYSLTWFGITTPTILILGGVAGIAALLARFSKSPLNFLLSDIDRNVVLHLVVFCAPFLAIIVLDSTVYDGWRQLYFVYPAFILVLLYGLSLLQSTKAWMPVLAVYFLSLLITAVELVRLHPHQQVYFNVLQRGKAENELRQTWEMDYWGASYLQGLKYILAHDTSDTIRISVATEAGEFNSLILPRSDRARLQFIAPIEADYFLTNYRWHPEPYREYEDMVWKKWTAYGSAYLTVFKLE